MDFDAYLKENLGFHSNLYHENPLQPQLVDGFPNQAMFPTFDQPTFSNLVSSNFNPHFDRFQASSSANTYLKNDHFTLPSGANEFLHGGLINFPNSKASGLMEVQNQETYHQPLKNFQDIGSSITTDTCVTADKGLHDQNAKKEKKEVKRKHRATGANLQIIKGQWTSDEDKLLIELVKQYGKRRWCQIGQMLPGRLGKQCRERWHNHLRPDIKKDAWSEEEDKMLIEAHKKMGNRWAEIARWLPGRSENTIKNHWNATKRRQLSSGRKNSNPKYNTVLQNYIQTLISAEDQLNSIPVIISESNNSNAIVGPNFESDSVNVGMMDDDKGMMDFSSNYDVEMWDQGCFRFGNGLESDEQKQQLPLMDDPSSHDYMQFDFDMGKDMSFLEMLYQ